MPCGATQDSRVMVERSDRMWSTGEGNGKPLQYSCLENPMNTMKTQHDKILKEELPRSVGAQYATGDQWRNNSRHNDCTRLQFIKRSEPLTKRGQLPLSPGLTPRQQLHFSVNTPNRHRKGKGLFFFNAPALSNLGPSPQLDCGLSAQGVEVRSWETP